MKCYICDHDTFIFFVKLKGPLDVEGINAEPIMPNPSPICIETILCEQCGVIQYIGARTENKWMTGNVSLKWDSETKKLIEPERMRKIIKHRPKEVSDADFIKVIQALANSGELSSVITKETDGKEM